MCLKQSTLQRGKIFFILAHIRKVETDKQIMPSLHITNVPQIIHLSGPSQINYQRLAHEKRRSSTLRQFSRCNTFPPRPLKYQCHTHSPKCCRIVCRSNSVVNVVNSACQTLARLFNFVLGILKLQPFIIKYQREKVVEIDENSFDCSMSNVIRLVKHQRKRKKKRWHVKSFFKQKKNEIPKSRHDCKTER